VAPASVVAILRKPARIAVPSTPFVSSIGDLLGRHALELRRDQALVDSGRADDVHAGRARDVPQQQHVAPDAEGAPLDHEVDPLGPQFSRGVDAGADDIGPIDVHVVGVRRAEEIDEEMLMRKGVLDVLALNRPHHRLQDGVIDARRSLRVRVDGTGEAAGQNAAGSDGVDQEGAAVEILRVRKLRGNAGLAHSILPSEFAESIWRVCFRRSKSAHGLHREDRDRSGNVIDLTCYMYKNR
jgi:hypothetical protein